MSEKFARLADDQVEAIAVRTSALVLEALRAAGAAPADETAVVWRSDDGRYFQLAGTAKHLPGAKFVHFSQIEHARADIDRAFVQLNCRVDADGRPNGAFGDLFAQADSVLTPALQGKFTPNVCDVVWSHSFSTFVLDRSDPVGASQTGFPEYWASRDTSLADLVEWSRQTAAHIASITGGWKQS